MTAPTLPRTVVVVRQRVIEIIKAQEDDEQAHSLEDKLYKAVLQAIANPRKGDAAPAVLAREALKAADLDFNRWLA